MAQDRDIKYVNKDFGDFRSQLIEYAKNYFPDSYNDFSPSSPGMMFIEMAAYVGDVLSFYQDTQLQETYIQHAKNPANLYNLAYMMGYRPKTTTPSEVDIEVSHVVGASGGNPDWTQALNIPAYTRLKSTVADQVNFFIEKPINFTFSSSYDNTEVTVETLQSGNPSQFRLTKTAKAISGELKTVTQAITSVEKFKTITIDDTNIIGVLSVTENNGATIWYEVPFLGQDTVFIDNTNNETDKQTVPYSLTLQRVPRRFVTRFTATGQLQIQFGAGIAGQDDSVLTPDPTNVGFGTNQGVKRIDYAYDPSNFLSTKSYGLAPSNTTLTIKYLVGGGVAANAPANTINTLVSAITDPTNSLTFNNPLAAAGGRDGDTVDELRENSLRAFNEQGRAVTLQDYTVRALSMASKYGSIAKIYATQDQLTNPNSTTDSIIDSNPLSLSMFTLAYDNNKNLTPATSTLKSNLKTYLSEYMILSDALNIKDAFIVNIGVTFDIIVKPNFSGRDVLLACTNRLKDHFDITKWNINQPINLSSIYTLLDQEKGVQTVQKIEVINNVGGTYSQYAYDIQGATRNNIVYPSYDPCIFEVKFPDTDIKGRITTL
ncbi:hypothetical protein UFOVP54_82 [uncultured Caudovirales phage]|uniref:Baseplate wedge subunit n=1 Tax=uncultured Caudovirales phage TaxID=2100421 RepID=A0A6J5KYA9_9CAUD|nr:hypothetical protein UFOVP54_82 [uncultured Caudovirales phage]